MTDTAANPYADPAAKPAGTTVYHPTLKAMAAIDNALGKAVAGLDPAARQAVLQFAASRCAELLASANGLVRP